MNKSHYIRRLILKISGLLASIVFLGLTHLSIAEDKLPKTQERIGVFDSRSVAVAFAGSALHENQLRQLMTDHKKAKEAGDLDKVAKLEVEGKARQEKAHKQAFSTAPVDEILAQIPNALSEIQKTAGVVALVSKWDEARLKKYSGADKVDVTMKLVDAFQPTERQRKSAIEIQKHKPISLEQAARIKD